MSYIKRVLADRPLGFWNLDSTSDLTDRGNSIVVVSRPNAITDVISLNTSTYKDKDTNNFIKVKGLLLNSSADLYVPNVYNILGKGLEHLSFGIEFWFTIPPSNTDDNQNLIQFHELGNDVDQTVGGIYIYADTIYFSLNGSTKTYVVSKQLTSKDSQIHVFATYSNKTMSIYVNGILGQTISLPEDFEFVTEDKTNVRFQFKYESNPTLFNSLAIYNRALLDQEIKSHIYWGLNDGTPVSYVKGKNVSVIDINENINNYWYTKNFNNKSSFSEGASNNIVVDNLGITLPSGPYISTENSKTKINSISSFLNTNNFSISGTLDDWSALSSNFEILRLDGFDLSSYLSLIKSSNNKLRLNYVSTSETTTLIETGAVTSTNGKFIFSIDGSHASIYINGAGSFFGNIIPVKNSSSNLYFPLDTEVSTTFSEYIDIFNTYVDPNAFIDDSSQYTDSLILSVDREGNYVKKKGYWEYVVPASLFYNIVGSRISWDSATNQISKDITSNYFKSVYIEIDRGSGWEQIKNGMGIENFQTINDAGTDFKIRITLLSSFYIPNGMSESIYQPRLENLSISLYKDLSVLSDDSKYKVVPYYDSDNNLQHTYTLKNNNLNILSRSNNFGIKLNEGSAAAIINSTSNEGKKSLEFWFRPDVIGSEQDQYILDTQDSENCYIKFDKDNKEIISNKYFSGFTNKLMTYAADLTQNPNPITLVQTDDGITWERSNLNFPINSYTAPLLYSYKVESIPVLFLLINSAPPTIQTTGYISTDGGINWTLVFTGNSGSLYNARIVNPSNGGGMFSRIILFDSLNGTSSYYSNTFNDQLFNIQNQISPVITFSSIGSLPSPTPPYHVFLGQNFPSIYYNFIGQVFSGGLYQVWLDDSFLDNPQNVTWQYNLITSNYNLIKSNIYSSANNSWSVLAENSNSLHSAKICVLEQGNNYLISIRSQISLPVLTNPSEQWQYYYYKENSPNQGHYLVSNWGSTAYTNTSPINWTVNQLPNTQNLESNNGALTFLYQNNTFYVYLNENGGGGDMFIDKVLISSDFINWTTHSIIKAQDAQNVDIYLSQPEKKYIYDENLGFDSVYINGIDIFSNTKEIIIDEPLHFVCNYTDSNFNNIYLNKNTNLDGDLSATYGYISVYPNKLSASDAYDRYISFLTNNIEVINKSNSIGTLSEYSDGDAIVAYSGTSKQSEI